MPVDEARRFGVRVGLSTHAEREIDTAGADYIAVGPVYSTPTKEGRPAVGLKLVRYAASRARGPWFAIGGIDASNAAEVVAAGATRLAVVRAIGDAADPEAAARALRRFVARLAGSNRGRGEGAGLGALHRPGRREARRPDAYGVAGVDAVRRRPAHAGRGSALVRRRLREREGDARANRRTASRWTYGPCSR